MYICSICWLPPTSVFVMRTPGSRAATPVTLRAVGRASSCSRLMVCVRCVLCTSTSGASPVTVTDSSSAPTFRSALIVAVKSVGNSTAWRLMVWNPVSEKVTVYTPGRRSTILYCPAPSVVTVRVFSMSTSLDASTLTPGRTAPEVSLTTPAIALCAWTTAGSISDVKITSDIVFTLLVIGFSSTVLQ